jgi:hypothetical protein
MNRAIISLSSTAIKLKGLYMIAKRPPMPEGAEP